MFETFVLVNRLIAVSEATAGHERSHRSRELMGVARDRIELSTSRFSVARSYQLSYLALLQTQSMGDLAIREKGQG